jgi:pterin-4a-carbinolamine dehydratase
VQSLSLVHSLVAHYETVDHLPMCTSRNGEVTFELTRYDLGGKVTDRDVEAAKKIRTLPHSMAHAKQTSAPLR